MHTDRPVIAIGTALFELRYRGLFDPGRGFTFPCDAQGCVELDRLSEHARVNYLLRAPRWASTSRHRSCSRSNERRRS